MRQTIKERLKQFVFQKKMTIRSFEKKCNLSNGYINGISSSIGNVKLMNIAQAFPELNVEWLLTGEGEMIKYTENEAVNFQNVSNSKIKNINSNVSDNQDLIDIVKNLVEQNKTNQVVIVSSQNQIDKLISIIEKISK